MKYESIWNMLSHLNTTQKYVIKMIAFSQHSSVVFTWGTAFQIIFKFCLKWSGVPLGLSQNPFPCIFAILTLGYKIKRHIGDLWGGGTNRGKTGGEFTGIDYHSPDCWWAILFPQNFSVIAESIAHTLANLWPMPADDMELAWSQIRASKGNASCLHCEVLYEKDELAT